MKTLSPGNSFSKEGSARSFKDRLNGLRDEYIATPLPDDPQAHGGTTPTPLVLTEHERAVLGERIDAHIADAMDGIDRHVIRQRDVLNQQTLAERQRLILNAARLEHSNDDKLMGLAEAHAGAAGELARMRGEPEDTARAAGRSSVWSTAIEQRLGAGNSAGAVELFDKVRAPSPGSRSWLAYRPERKTS